MKKILAFLAPYRREVAMALLFLVVDVIAEIVQPALMARIVGRGITNGDMGYILRIGGLMILCAVVATASGIGNTRFASRAGTGFAANLREALFGKVQTFSFKNIDSFSTASLVTRLTNDVSLMQNTVIMSMRIVIRAPLMLVSSLFMAITMNPGLSTVLAVVIPLLVILLGAVLSQAFPRFQAMQKAVDRLSGSVRENLANVRVVKSFVREEYEKEKFKEANDGLTGASLHAMQLVLLNMPMMMLVMNLSVLAIVWFGGNQVIAGEIDVASMTAFINYLAQILMSLMMVSMLMVMLSRSSSSYKRIAEVLDAEVDLVTAPDAQDPEDVTGVITFEDVGFRYNQTQEENTLCDISFTARPGQVTAIIGGTGAGKTTLVSLIPRLYDATEGRILLDGRPLQSYSLEFLREKIGVVLQKNTLFSGTIADNLRWGSDNATDDEVVEAAKNAQAHEFIMAQAEGYHTWLEQGGVNLSGGQKQRLCIARALLKKPKILILDDSTSAVDTATEGRIRRAFAETLRDTATFIIAQRISSVRDADNILVMDNGRIVASGTHEELLATSPEYQEIYDSQQERKEA